MAPAAPTKPKHRIAEHMRRHWDTAASWKGVQDLAKELKVSDRTAGRYLDGTAELSAQRQESLLIDLGKYVWRLKESGTAVPVAVIERQAYDETRMRVKVTEDIAEGKGVAQLSKVFVVESSWAILLRVKKEGPAWGFCTIKGQYSHSVRASDSTAAPSVTAILNASPRVPRELSEQFPVKERLVESDEAPANARAERLWQGAHA